MTSIQRIAKNMAVLLLARIINMLLGFFYVMYTARYLGPNNYGILAFALALNGIFGVLVNFGLDPLTIREVARNQKLAEKYLSNGIVLKLAFGGLTLGIIWLVVNALNYPSLTRKVVYIITLSTIIAGINNLFNDIYQAFERMEYMAIAQILQSALSVGLAITAIELKLGVLEFALIYLIVNMVVLGYQIMITSQKFVKPTIETDVEFWRNMLREAWPFLIIGVSSALYYYTDSFMIFVFKGKFETGIYNAAYRLALVLGIIPTIYNRVMYPYISKEFKHRSEILPKILVGSITGMGALALLGGITILITAKWIVMTVYGSEYSKSTIPFIFISWAILFGYLNGVIGTFLDAIGHQRENGYRMLAGTLVNVGLNAFMIPAYGAVGAAISTLLARIFAGVLAFIMADKIVKRYYPPVSLKLNANSIVLTVNILKTIISEVKAYGRVKQ